MLQIYGLERRGILPYLISWLTGAIHSAESDVADRYGRRFGTTLAKEGALHYLNHRGLRHANAPLRALLAALLLGVVGQVRAGFVTDTLGAAGPSDFSLLALSTSPSVQIAGANNQPPLPGGGVVGNVGIASTATLGVSSPASITGNVLLAPGASTNFSSPSVVLGSVLTNQNLSAANTAALNAASTFAALAGTSIGAISGTTTINAANPGGVNVLNTSGINLGNGQTLTLSGPAGTQFVVNNSGGITLNSGSIVLTGGLTPDDVVINQTGGGTVSTAGGLNNESVINGIVLDPTGKFQLTPGLVNGEIIGGGQIALASGATINNTQPPPPVPAPPSLVLMGLGGLVFMGLTIRAGRRRAPSAV